MQYPVAHALIECTVKVIFGSLILTVYTLTIPVFIVRG